MAHEEQRMDYRRFERLIILVTVVLVVGAIAASIPSGGGTVIEVAAQIAIVAVVAAAAHWGRKAGTIWALVASIAYLAVRLPLIADGFSGPAILLVVSRIAGYLLLGIVGGEIFGRVKYRFALSMDSSSIDDFSRVYNERYAARAVRQALARVDRYTEPFSLVLLTLGAEFAGDGRTDHLRTLVRSVANVLRDDVRIIDDVAHLSDGRFAVLLPRTNARGAHSVASRLATAVGSAHGVNDGNVVSECLTAPEDSAAIEAFARQYEPAEDEAGVTQIGYLGSGA
jgi:GGDEF domain-containing protein